MYGPIYTLSWGLAAFLPGVAGMFFIATTSPGNPPGVLSAATLVPLGAVMVSVFALFRLARSVGTWEERMNIQCRKADQLQKDLDYLRGKLEAHDDLSQREIAALRERIARMEATCKVQHPNG